MKLSTLTRGILAATALSAASTSAHAVFSATPDPMAANGGSYTVDLQAAGHVSVALPGLGVSATDFIINGFVLNAPASHDSASGYVWVYNANFQAFDGATPVTGILTSTDFTVEVDGQHFPNPPLTGVFTEHLLSATFTDGTVTTFLDPAAVTPTGTVSIQTAATGFGYDILPPSLVINAQYSVDGTTYTPPPLTDVNGTNNGSATVGDVPEPATLALMVPGLLAIGARRRAAA